MVTNGQPSGSKPAFSQDLTGRLKTELYCLFLVFRFHDGNNHLRKAVTIMLVFVWSVIMIALTFEWIPATEPPFFMLLTLVVGTVLGRMWDFELNSYAGTLVEQRSNGGDDE